MTRTELVGKVTEVEGQWVPTLCDVCIGGECGTLVRRVGGVPVEVKGDPDYPRNKGKLCSKGIAALMSWHSPYRVKAPLKRGNPEKGIGVDPQWVEIGWDEALNIVAERLKKVRQDDPRKLLIWATDRGNRFTYGAFGHAFGTPNIGAGPSHVQCGGNEHPISLMYHGSMRYHVDFSLCNYLLLFASQAGSGVGTLATPSITEIADARARGMKVVAVDPRYSNTAAIADEWIPIRPGTDTAFALTLLNLLLNDLKIYDVPSLKQYTNGPYLVGPDQLYARDKATGKPLVWDDSEGKARAFDAADPQNCALEGSFTVDGVSCKTGFQLLKEQVMRYTPEMGANITTVPAETLRRVAQEIGKAAQIGSTITIGGKQLPLRPFGVIWHHGSNAHTHSMMCGLSIQLLPTVLGANDVPGGVLALPPQTPSDFVANADGLLRLRRAPISITRAVGIDVHKPKPPETTALTELYPYRFGLNALEPLVICDPKRYKLPYEPEMVIQCRTNVMTGGGSPVQVGEALKKLFIVSIVQEINEVAEFADIVFPEPNNWESLSFWPDEQIQSVGLGYTLYSLVQPVVDPPFKAPFKVHGAASIMLELAHRAGFLPDVNKLLNVMLELKGPHRLDPSQKYDFEDISDRRIRSILGEGYSLDWFREHGFLKVERTVEQAYTRLFHKARVPVYLEEFVHAKAEIDKVCQEIGLDFFNTSDYQPLPEWKPCPAYSEGAPGYDLFAVVFKVATHALGHTTSNPWLVEVADLRRSYDVWVNPSTAARREIEDGDALLVESADGVTLKGKAKLTEAIHPEVIGIPGTFGQWARGRPLAKGRGVLASSLYMRRLDRHDFITGSLDHCIRVKVSKA